jgi:hypothetical protein
MNKELTDKFNLARKKLRSVCYWLADNKEPLHVIQEMNYNIMALRAEMTTMMDLFNSGAKFEENEYMKQMVHRLDEVTRTICTAADVMVDSFGMNVIDLKKIRQEDANRNGSN